MQDNVQDALEQEEAMVSSTSSLRKVQFKSSVSLIEDFIPYADVYGVHPATFEFDAHGHMVQRSPRSRSVSPSPMDLEDLLSVDLGNLLECTAPNGVSYRSQPNFSSSAVDGVESLEEGDQTEVLQRKGEWFRDSIGWLPLVADGVPVFSVRYL